jgi:hypothetical protein
VQAVLTWAQAVLVLEARVAVEVADSQVIAVAVAVALACMVLESVVLVETLETRLERVRCI